MTLKTRPTKASVDHFLQEIPDQQKMEDCKRLDALMQKITGIKPVMWGDSIVGYGTFHYKYSSGREGDWFITGFSPRKQNISIYIMNGFDHYGKQIAKLGKVKTSVSCLYVKRLADLDEALLEEILRDSVKSLRARYGPA